MASLDRADLERIQDVLGKLASDLSFTGLGLYGSALLSDPDMGVIGKVSLQYSTHIETGEVVQEASIDFTV